MSHEEQVERWAERAMDRLDAKFHVNQTMTQDDYDAEARLIKIVADDAMKPQVTTGRGIKPRDYTQFDAFCADYVKSEVAKYEPITPYDDYLQAQRKMQIRADVAIEATQAAIEIWDDFVENAQEHYDRGIGPAWD